MKKLMIFFVVLTSQLWAEDVKTDSVSVKKLVAVSKIKPVNQDSSTDVSTTVVKPVNQDSSTDVSTPVVKPVNQDSSTDVSTPVVKSITDKEREKLIRKSLKSQEKRDEILKNKIEIITNSYLDASNRNLKNLKSVLREESEYRKDIDKIKNSTFLTSRLKNKKISYTNNRLRKVLVKKDDLVDDLEKEAYKQLGIIAGEKAKQVISLSGTDKVIAKMNVRLELMKIGKSILKKTEEKLSGSYNIKIVDEVIDDMERNFIRKYEELVSIYK